MKRQRMDATPKNSNQATHTSGEATHLARMFTPSGTIANTITPRKSNTGKSRPDTKTVIVLELLREQRRKSMGIAIVLALLFGPLGVFYSSIIGGTLLTLLAIPVAAMVAIAPSSAILLAPALSLLSIVATVIATDRHNTRVDRELTELSTN